MLTCVRRRVAGRQTRSDDDGFTMIELMVAIAIISVVMLALTSLFVVSNQIDLGQGDRQTAIQTADDAMERARAMDPAALLTGRDSSSSTDQWTKSCTAYEATTTQPSCAIPAVQSLLPNLTMSADTTAASGAGASATLPTTYRPVQLNGVYYKQYWYVGLCQRSSAASSLCVAPPLVTLAKVTLYYQVIVAVTWPDRICANGICSYVTSSLIGKVTDEPVFNTNASAIPLSISSSPGTQTNDQNVSTSLPMTSSGGTAPILWKATGLPSGLSISPTTGTISGTPLVTGTSAVTVTVSDAYAQQDYVAFSWVIKALPTIGTQSALSTPGGVAYTKTYTASNGVTPYTWSATGLPPGMTIPDTTVGTVSGTPTTVGAYTVAITATDAQGQKATSNSFTWTVPALAISSFTVPTTTQNTAITSITLAATGGIKPYVTWSATGLPTGLSLDSSGGVISGTPTVKSTFAVVLTLTDTAGNTATKSFSWKVS